MRTITTAAPASCMSNEEVDALLARLGVEPDRLLDRQATSELLARLGVALSVRTLHKNASLRRPMPPYRMVARRALTAPRDVVRFVYEAPIRSPQGESELAAA
jgi:hypothetical protein